MAVAASVLAFAGVVLAGLVIVVVARRAGTLSLRRLAAVVAIGLVTGAGVYDLRAGDASSFFSFLKTGKAGAPVSAGIQTGSQRVLLSYLGLRMWEGHPLLGVGFERSFDHYQPYLAAAKRRFPDQHPEAFPSAKHPWGVQNFWIQLLADVGIVGLVLGVATFIAGIALALRVPSNLRLIGLIAAGWICVTVGSFNGTGIVSGLPLDALVWIGLGLGASVGGLE
jgi:O-antigen ligase